MIRRQIEWRGKVHRDYGFLSGYRLVAACSLIRFWMYTARLNTVARRESCLQNNRYEVQRSIGKLALIERHVRWRVKPRGYVCRRKRRRPACPAHVRVRRKNSIYLDDYIRYVACGRS